MKTASRCVPNRPTAARLKLARALWPWAWAVSLVVTAASATAAGHICAWRVDPPRANFPPVMLGRMEYAASTQEAACMFADAQQVFTGTSDCVQSRVDKAVRCVAVPTDPVIDRIERNPAQPGGVEGAVGPRKAYRCKLLQGRTTPWERVEAASWADVEAAGSKAYGYRSSPSRGGCIPSDTYENLMAWAGGQGDAVPVNDGRAAAPERAAAAATAAAPGSAGPLFRCMVLKEVPGSAGNNAEIFDETGPRDDMVAERLRREHCTGTGQCRVKCSPDTPAARADRAARAQAANGGSPPPSPAPPKMPAAAERSPWLDAVQANNARGPCADAANACRAQCGATHPGAGSDAAMRVSACRSDCDRTRAQCALKTAEPLTEGEPGRAATAGQPAAQPPAQPQPSAAPASAAVKKASEWLERLKKAVPKP